MVVSVRLIEGDCIEQMRVLAAEGLLVDSVITDPPYHLIATQNRFGAENSSPAQYGKDGAMSRLSGGFMGQKWDGGDIAFRPETWSTAASVLRPGGFLLAFGGTRTYHKLVTAIEAGGFVIQDAILWIYGSGFPKRKDMLKPAVEIICVAYKPGAKRTLQVDECRIPGTTQSGAGSTGFAADRADNYEIGRGREYQTNGRWPANVCHDGSDEVMKAFAAFGDTKSTGGINSRGPKGIIGWTSSDANRGGLGDSGTPARYFYCAKADAQDRWGSRHPTVKPVELLKWLVSLVTPQWSSLGPICRIRHDWRSGSCNQPQCHSDRAKPRILCGHTRAHGALRGHWTPFAGEQST